MCTDLLICCYIPVGLLMKASSLTFRADLFGESTPRMEIVIAGTTKQEDLNS